MLLLLVTAFVFLFSTTTKQAPTTVSEEQKMINDTISDIPLSTPQPTASSQDEKNNTNEQLLKNFGGTLDQIATPTMEHWIVAKDQWIVLTGRAIYISEQNINNEIKDSSGQEIKDLQTKIDTYFIKHGFQKNALNTFRLQTPESQFSGYTKKDTKCLVQHDYQQTNNTLIYAFCGEKDEKKTQWQNELTPAINPTNDPRTAVIVQDIVGNYAIGSAGGRYGGGGVAWIAMKQNGTWKEIWSGQDTISCKIVNTYTIPKEIYGDCQ